MFSSKTVRLASLFATMLVAFSMVTVDTAEARRGGSFGSRGTRTFQSAPPTNTVPQQVQPIQRSTTPSTPQTNATRPNTATAPRPNSGFFGSPLMRGLFLGGLFGLFMGYGFGGIAGMFGFLFQLLLIGGGIWLLMRLMRTRSAPRPAMAGGMNHSPYQGMPGNAASYGAQASGGGRSNSRAGRNNDELGLGASDLDRFEQMLTEVQDAYGREDFETLRRLTTPEIMSYLSQELGENAAKGLRNEVSDVKLLQGSISESWREGQQDYATVALRYSSRDAMRDRETGRVVSGDADRPSETAELWTFTRINGGDWRLSAIQEA